VGHVTVDGVYMGDSYGLETFERLDIFLNLEKSGHKFSEKEKI
jgi:hypothetical protein